LATSTVGAEIYYTTNGTTPSKTNGKKYTTTFEVKANDKKGKTIVIKAIGVKEGMNDSAVSTKNIVFKASAPVASKLNYSYNPYAGGENYGTLVDKEVDIVDNKATLAFGQLDILHELSITVTDDNLDTDNVTVYRLDYDGKEKVEWGTLKYDSNAKVFELDMAPFADIGGEDEEDLALATLQDGNQLQVTFKDTFGNKTVVTITVEITEVPDVSEYEFEIDTSSYKGVAVGTFSSDAGVKISIGESDDDGTLNSPGTKSLAALETAIFGSTESGVELADYVVKVTLKPTIVGHSGHENSLIVEKLEVKKGGIDAKDDVKVYLYAYSIPAWFDLVRCEWGKKDENTGFSQGADEENDLFAYVFASKTGEYTITFKVVDIKNSRAEVATGYATVTVE
jgi:hypothetical protein